MSLAALLMGEGVLITGMEPDVGGWLRVYVGARWRNVYFLVEPAGADRMLRQWGHGQHLLTSTRALESERVALFEGDPILGLA